MNKTKENTKKILFFQIGIFSSSIPMETGTARWDSQEVFKAHHFLGTTSPGLGSIMEIRCSFMITRTIAWKGMDILAAGG